MRKLSMKNPGTPAIEEDSERGSGGVSAEGFGARLPRLGLACAPPPEPFACFSCEAPREVPDTCVPDGVFPCACWPLTCGAVPVVGVVGGAVCVGVEEAGASVVGLGVLVLGVVSGAGAGVVSGGAAFSVVVDA